MEQNKTQKYIERIKKGHSRVMNAEWCSFLLAGITGAGAVIGALSGATAEIVAAGCLDNITHEVVDTDGFQASIRERRDALISDFSEGKISYSEFQQQYENLYSCQEVINYSTTAGDENLTSQIESYNKAKDFSNTIFNKGVPTMLGMAGVGALGVVTTDAIRKKYEAKLALIDKTEESEMAD